MIDDLDKHHDMPPFIMDAAELLTAIDAAGVHPTGELSTIDLVGEIAMMLDAARCNRHRFTADEMARGILQVLSGRLLVDWKRTPEAALHIVAKAIEVG